MKYRYILFLMLFSVGFSLTAQQQGKVISHYLFPSFVEGTVLLKNGTRNPAMLNYNAASEEMVFDQNGQMLAIADVTINQIDTVFVSNKKFIVRDKKFAEVLLDDPRYKLLAEHKCRVIPPAKPAAYGGTSQTSSTTSYSSWMGDGKVYQLQLPDDFKVNPYTVYWLNTGSVWKSFTSIGQIKKFYSKKKALYKKYTDEQKVNFEDQASVAHLIHYMETN